MTRYSKLLPRKRRMKKMTIDDLFSKGWGEGIFTTPKYEIPKHIQSFTLNVTLDKKGNIKKIEPIL